MSEIEQSNRKRMWESAISSWLGNRLLSLKCLKIMLGAYYYHKTKRLRNKALTDAINCNAILYEEEKSDLGVIFCLLLIFTGFYFFMRF